LERGDDGVRILVSYLLKYVAKLEPVFDFSLFASLPQASPKDDCASEMDDCASEIETLPMDLQRIVQRCAPDHRTMFAPALEYIRAQDHRTMFAPALANIGEYALPELIYSENDETLVIDEPQSRGALHYHALLWLSDSVKEKQ